MSLALESVPCSFCGQNQTTLLLKQDGFNIVECVHCGLLYVNPRPSRTAIPAYYAASYYAHSQGKGFTARLQQWRGKLLLAIAFHHGNYPRPSNTDLHVLWRWDWRLLAAIFKRRFKRILPYQEGGNPPRALDIGSGSGAYLLILQQLGWEAWGVEPDPAGVTLARERGCPNVYQGTLEDLHLADESFKLVTCWDSLEHTFDPGCVLQEVQRLLKPGGWLFVKVPHPRCLEARLWRQDWAGYDLPRHLYHFTPHRIREYLVEQGFKIHDFSYVTPPNMIASGLIQGLVRRWRRLAWLGHLHGWLTIACIPLAWLLDTLGWGNTYQIVARKGAMNGEGN